MCKNCPLHVENAKKGEDVCRVLIGVKKSSKTACSPSLIEVLSNA
ncbi:MAG: hypothetical protein ACLP29_02025 [Dissulfurispiraceae bacterium]